MVSSGMVHLLDDPECPGCGNAHVGEGVLRC